MPARLPPILRWLLLVAGLTSAGCDVAFRPTPLRETPPSAVAPSPAAARSPADQPARNNSPASTDAGWPNFLGPRHDGTSPETEVSLDWPAEGPPVLWRIEIGTGYSSPVVVGDDLIVMHRIGDEEIIECFSAATGESKWRFTYPTDYECPYQYSSGPYSTPAIDGGRVYAWSAEGTLRCLELASGELHWQRHLNEEYGAELGMFPVAGSVFIEKDRLILNVGGRETEAGIVALDKTSGKTLWTATGHGPGDATAVAATIHGRRYIFMFTADGLVSLDPANGHVHWQIPFRATAPDTSNATTPVVCGDKVFVSAYKAGSLCVRVSPEGGYEELWRKRRNLMCQFHNLMVRGGCVYGFASNDHSFRCVDLTTGEVNWKREPEHGRGQTVALGDSLITIFETGHLASVEVSPQACNMRSVTSAPLVAPRCFSTPALCGGRIYLRSDGDLACLSLRRGQDSTSEF